MERTYEVHQALAGDSNEGWILIKPSPQDKKLGDACQLGRRPIVCIKGAKFKPVYAEALLADEAYLDQVLSFLQTRPPKTKQRAEEYIRKAPPQIDTQYRRQIEVELNWTPIPGRESFSP